MKRILLTLVLLVATTVASAHEIRYFNYAQAQRTLTYLNSQNEVMIYCGYPDEIPTYALVNEFWAEPLNSAFYEIWIYAYDAYTGEEIFMPIDLSCIWLYSHNQIYSAAATLRFHGTRPQPTHAIFAWHMPCYHPYTHCHHPHDYYCTYHHDIHRPGWHYSHHHHYHPYYDRHPNDPFCYVSHPYTPGIERPQYRSDNGHQYIGAVRVTSTRTAAASSSVTATRSSAPANGRGQSAAPAPTNSRTQQVGNSRGESDRTDSRSESGRTNGNASATTPSRSQQTGNTDSRTSTPATPSRGQSATTSSSSTRTQQNSVSNSTPSRSTSTTSSTTSSTSRGTTTSSRDGKKSTSSTTTTSTTSRGTTSGRSTSSSEQSGSRTTGGRR